MEEVEPRRATAGMQELEQRGRPAGTLEVRTTHDSMDGGGRTASGTAVEEQLSERLPRTASGTAVEERPARVSSAVSCPK
jgi:hypothetical protein